MKIICNNVPRDVLTWFELSASERAEFDYLGSDYLDSEERQLAASFVRYRGVTYDLGEFIRTRRAPHPQQPDWEKFDGYQSDSYFSGVLVRYVDGGERVILATFIA